MAHQVKKGLGATATDDGVEFRVWTPFASAVSVSGSAASKGDFALTSEEDGYWSGVIPGAQVGQYYRYIITTNDGRTLVKNDPYARQLTESDNGYSVIVDNSFDWGDHQFVTTPKEKQVIYEIHVGTFNRPDASTSGTFYTAIEKLDYLESLGVTMVELMPIMSMATSNGWGYAPNHIFSIEGSYGGRRGFLEFVKACHDRDIGVTVDVVYNHFSTNTELWQFDGWSENDRGGIYFYNDPRGDTPWGGRPDYGRAEVRQFIFDNVAMLFGEYHIDGLRIDSTIYMRNTKGPEGDESTAIPEAWTLLQDIANLAHKINPAALLIAEDSSGEAKVTTKNDYGLGFDTQWGFRFPYEIRDALGIYGSQNLDGIASEMPVTYNGDPFQKVIFTDSHDTAANGGVRLNEAASTDNGTSALARKRSLIASAVMLTSAGVPMLLQGGEFMQRGSFNDWQMLDWDKTGQFAGMVLAHQHMIGLRVDTYGNTGGLSGHSTNIFHRDDVNSVLGYHRWEWGGVGDDVLVLVNFGKHKLENYWLSFPLPGNWIVRFNSSWKGYSPDFHETHLESVTPGDDLRGAVEMADYSVIILSQDKPESTESKA